MSAVAAPQQAAAPILVEDGAIKVDAEDLRAGLLRLPEEQRGNILISYDRIATFIDNLFITRSLAGKAREVGLDRDPIVQRRMAQAAEAVLAELYAARLEREVLAVDLEQRVRELYRADPSKFKTEEQVRIEHVLVNLRGRTRDSALERARMIAQKARAGEDFPTLVSQYSDDADKRVNRGDLGFSSPNALAAGIREALPGMKPGEISQPLETEHGFHVVKFVERRPPQQLSFDMVRDQLVRGERTRLVKQRLDQVVTQVRSSPTAMVHRENVEALVVPLPTAISSGKVHEQASKK